MSMYSSILYQNDKIDIRYEIADCFSINLFDYGLIFYFFGVPVGFVLTCVRFNSGFCLTNFFFSLVRLAFRVYFNSYFRIVADTTLPV